MKKTDNYQLNQWDETDLILREDFNGDNEKVDAALDALAQTMAGKADSAAVSALSARVAAKAEQTALTAEENARSSADSALNDRTAALEAAVALRGNCQIYHGGYTGDGKTTRTLTFPGRPLLVMCMGDNLVLSAIQGVDCVVCRTAGQGGAYCSAEWSGTSLTWYPTGAYALNVSGEPYQVVALMDAAE